MDASSYWPGTRRARLALLALPVALLGGAAAAHQLVQSGFASHMVIHVLNVAFIAPLLAWCWVHWYRRTGSSEQANAFPLAAAFAEFVVVWGWHVPTAYEAARASFVVFVIEQGSFLAVAWWLWVAALIARYSGRRALAGQSVAAMLFTSMHMTLLGTVLGMAPRFFYGSGATPAIGSICTAGELEQMHIGGAIMLVAAGSVYLAGGLWLAWQLLTPDAPEANASRR